MCIDIIFFLPHLKFLYEGTGFVFSAQYGLLQGLDDVRFFVFLFGFLGEDDRFDGFDRFFLLCRGDVLGHGSTDNVGYIGAASVDVDLAVMVMVDNVVGKNLSAHSVQKKHRPVGQTVKSANLE